MKNCGLEMKKSTRVYLKRNTESKFKDVCHLSIGDEIYFFGENLSKIELVEKVVELQIELHSVQKELSELKGLSHIQRRGELIKADICSKKDCLPWPPRPEDLNPENCNYPEKLEQLIYAIFKNQPDRMKFSIMQDLVYNVPRGRVKTPKSVLLPSIMKNLTNNTELSIY